MQRVAGDSFAGPIILRGMLSIEAVCAVSSGSASVRVRKIAKASWLRLEHRAPRDLPVLTPSHRVDHRIYEPAQINVPTDARQYLRSVFHG